MIAALPRLLFVRLLGALLLATVGLQAGVAGLAAVAAAPLERTHGSAFSASTHEVALAAQRRVEPARLAVAPEPHRPNLVPARPPARLLPARPAPRPASTAPPAREDIARRPAPRAPPHA